MTGFRYGRLGVFDWTVHIVPGDGVKALCGVVPSFFVELAQRNPPGVCERCEQAQRVQS